MSSSRRGLAALATESVVALALFGCIPVAVKYVHANAYTIGIVRLAIATLFTIIATGIRGELRRVSGRDLLRLLLIGVIFFGHWLTYFLSVKISSVSIAQIGLSTYGVDLLILGALAGHGPITRSDLAAVVLAIAGAVIVVPNFSLGGGAMTGMALALASALLYATLPILHQRYVEIPMSLRTLGQFGFALLCFLLFLPKSNWNLTAVDWAGLAFLGFGATLVAHTLWVRVTTDLTPAVASIIYYGNVPFAVLLGVIILGEPLTWRTVAGGLLIIAGSLAGLLPQLKQRRDALVTPET